MILYPYRCIMLHCHSSSPKCWGIGLLKYTNGYMAHVKLWILPTVEWRKSVKREQSSSMRIERLYENEGVFSSSRVEQVEHPSPPDWNHIRQEVSLIFRLCQSACRLFWTTTAITYSIGHFYAGLDIVHLGRTEADNFALSTKWVMLFFLLLSASAKLDFRVNNAIRSIWI